MKRLQKVSELKYFSKQLRLRWTEYFEKMFWCRICIRDEECVVPLNLLSLVGIGYNQQSYSLKIIVLVELAETRSEVRERA